MGVLGVVIAYMLLAQAVFAGLSQSLMLGSLAQPQAVICSVHGPYAAPVDPDAAPDHATKCPCAILCQLGSSFAPAVAALDSVAIALPADPVRLALPVITQRHADDGVARFATEARAPPPPSA